MYKRIFFVILIKYVTCQRRITNGSFNFNTTHASFVVQLLPGRLADHYDDWICTGTIIHPYLILTSAACMKDVPNVYAIAGYDKYIKKSEFLGNNCTTSMGIRVIRYCLPNNYDLHDYDVLWGKADIAIAKTEREFGFYDTAYLKFCSYMPTMVELQYNTKFEESGRTVLMFGWGHSKFFSPAGDERNFNEKSVQYTSSLIMDREDCVKFFEDKDIKQTIWNHFICISGDDGRMRSNGTLRYDNIPEVDECLLVDEEEDYTRDMHLNKQNATKRPSGTNKKKRKRTKPRKPRRCSRRMESYNTRRHGICMNDHGGPLITFIGGKPYVIGVASTPAVTATMECIGPYLFTSVACSSKFIHCILASQFTKHMHFEGNRRNLDSICTNKNRPLFSEFNITWQPIMRDGSLEN